MKRFLVAVSIIFCGSWGYCSTDVTRSSFTQTQDFEKTLCGQYVVNGSTVVRRGRLYTVTISSAGGAGSALSVCNSSFTTNNGDRGSCANIDTRTFEGTLSFNTVFTSGMIYSSTGTATKAIQYDCY